MEYERIPPHVYAAMSRPKPLGLWQRVLTWLRGPHEESPKARKRSRYRAREFYTEAEFEAKRKRYAVDKLPEE